MKQFNILLNISLLALVINIVNGQDSSFYNKYRVFTVTPNTENQLKLIRQMQTYSDSYNFMVHASKITNEIPVIVPPNKLPEFVDFLNNNEIKFSKVTDDLQKELDIVLKDMIANDTEEFGWHKYYPVISVNNWLKNMTRRYPRRLKLINMGRSYEKRDLVGVKLIHEDNDDNDKVSVLLEGGIHASEWISVSVATYVLNELLTSNDRRVRKLAKDFNWYVLPIVNPDGYQYTIDKDVYWRKTLKPYGSCIGADGNRNWDIAWNASTVDGGSLDCSPIFSGPYPFSEFETKSYSDYVKRHLNDTLKVYISLHAFAQKLLLPYAYTEQLPRNYDDLLEVGKNATEVLKQLYNTTYSVGNVYDQIYSATGSAMDWMYDKMSVPFTYTYELRPQTPDPTDFYKSFKLPTNQIVPTCKETFNSIVEIIVGGQSLDAF